MDGPQVEQLIPLGDLLYRNIGRICHFLCGKFTPNQQYGYLITLILVTTIFIIFGDVYYQKGLPGDERAGPKGSLHYFALETWKGQLRLKVFFFLAFIFPFTHSSVCYFPIVKCLCSFMRVSDHGLVLDLLSAYRYVGWGVFVIVFDLNQGEVGLSETAFKYFSHGWNIQHDLRVWWEGSRNRAVLQWIQDYDEKRLRFMHKHPELEYWGWLYWEGGRYVEGWTLQTEEDKAKLRYMFEQV